MKGKICNEEEVFFMREIKKRYKKIVALVLCLGMMTGMFEGVPGLGEYSVVAEAAYANHNYDGRIACTWYAWKRAQEKLGITFPNNWGHAVSWYSNASIAGYETNSTIPKANSLAVWSHDTDSMGHVAFVEEVIGNSVYLSEGGSLQSVNGIYSRVVNKNNMNRSWYSNGVTTHETLLGYIYLDGGNSNTTNSSVQTQSPSINQDLSETKYNYIQETTFGRKAVFRNPSGRQIEDLGMVLYDENGKEITRNHEGTHSSGVGSYKQESFIYEDVTKDLGIVLEPETNYFYQFFIKVAGSDLVYSDRYSIQTGGKKTPNTPSISIDKTHVAAGDSVTVTWQADVAAVNGYDITVVSEDGTYKRTITVNDKNAFSASVSVPNVGTYRIMAVAKGKSKNSGTAVSEQTITAHDSSTVTFVQNTENGEEVLKMERVPYGHKATAPSAPSREGYTFQGWDKDYSKVTEDLKVTANYKINTYTVKFVGENGTILKEERAQYKSAVQPPEAPASTKPGYVFGGWSSNDYECVKQNATIKASYVWENNELPIIVSDVKCEYKDTGYLLTYTIANYPTSKTTGRAIVSLKTSTGKLVATTESSAFTIDKDVTKSNQEIFVPYEGVASTAEIVIVDKFSSGIPISKSQSCGVSREWSAWQTTKPEGNYVLESRTEYRSQDKVTTTSSASSLPGWTLYNTSESWSDWGNWSSWSRNSYSSSDSRQVETQNVTDSNGYKINNYYYYRYWNSTYGQWYYTYSSSMGGTKYTFSQREGDSPAMYWYANYDGHNAYRLNNNNGGYGVNFNNEIWYLESTQNVDATSHTEWRYRDRSKNYTYYYYKWNGWSDWTSESITASDNKQVETRTTYRYKSDVQGEEDNTGNLREVTGSVPTEFAGKQATLLVYKNEEAADYNNEYVGQSEINEDGTYHFSFISREEPSAETGDFTIDLAIEGATESIYVDTIKAPLPKYTVTFVDWDGTEISKQEIIQGETAVLPENPEREHYKFTGWDTGTTNVREDLMITAQYEKEIYTVVWVDWNRQNFAIDTYTYGEKLLEPSLTEVEGYELVSWKDENGETPAEVTKNIVLTAEYKIKEYTIKFYDWEGNCINTQIVEYGKSALVPETPVKTGMVFEGWSSADYTCVKGDLDIYPNFSYEETVENPEVDVTSGAYEHSFTVKLSGEEGAAVYYTTDGSKPDQYSQQYQNAIEINKNTVLQFIACKEGKNASEIQKAVYLISETEDTQGILKIKKSSWELEAGSTTDFEYTLYREDGDNEVEFFSLNDDVAEISENGKIHANGTGSTQIFAITKDLKYADFCTINVTSNEIPVSEIKLEKNVICISPEGNEKIEATVEPANATNQELSWFSDDSQIAEVSKEGKIIGKSMGITSLRGYSYTGNCYIDCTVVVAEPSVELADTAIVVEQGEQVTEEANIIGSIEQEFHWESDNETVATVDETGLITGIAPGQAKISYVSEDNQYKASVIVIVTDKQEEKVSIENSVVSEIGNVTYTGKEMKPEVKVESNGKTLTVLEDYSIVFSNNVNAGTAMVYIIGKGNYTGVVEKTFTILPADIASVSIKEIGEQKYTGGEVKPDVVVKSGSKVLSEGIDYVLTYENNTNVGIGNVVISGLGNYTGTKTYSFKIVAASQPSPVVTKAPTPIITKTPTVTKTPTPTITKAPTKAPEKVTAPAKPKIKSVKNVKGKKMTIKLSKKVSGAAGYQVTYATNSKFTVGKKNVDMKSTSKTISKLKKGKTYYVKVRAYKKDSKGKKIYGKYSSVKKVKIKK